MQAHKLFLLGILLLATGLLVGCGKAQDTSGSPTVGSGSGSSSANPDPSPQPSVGIPDQNSMSLSVSEYNVDCLNIDGVTSDITIRLADQLNNNTTIPDGTIVYFAAEGGAIDAQCETAKGACTVTWTCQDYRPPDGRVTVLAWTLGTESFNDNNSNGFFDTGDSMVVETDRGEPFIDKDEDGVRDTDEEFVNYPNPGLNTGGTYDVADGLYSGVNCAYPGKCAANQSIFIYRQTVLVMSDGDSLANIFLVEDNGTEFQTYTGGTPIDLDNGGAGFVTLLFLVTDSNGNPLPVGSTVSFSTAAGEITSQTSIAVPNTNVFAGVTSPWPYSASPLVFGVRIQESPDNPMAENGDLKVTVTVDNVVTEGFLPLFDPAN